MRGTGEKFIFKCTEAAKEFLLDEGIDFKYGARHLKRAIERFLVFPLSNLVATGQIGLGDLLIVDYSPEIGKLTFSKESEGALVTESSANILDLDAIDDHHSLNAEAIAPEATVAPARARARAPCERKAKQGEERYGARHETNSLRSYG